MVAMVRQFLVTLTPAQLAFPALPQAELPSGFGIDSWSIVNNGDVAVELAFGQIRKDETGADIVDLTAAAAGGGPGSAWTFNTRSWKVWLRCATAPAADITVQLNAVKEK